MTLAQGPLPLNHFPAASSMIDVPHHRLVRNVTRLCRTRCALLPRLEFPAAARHLNPPYAAIAMSVLRGFRLESIARELFEVDGVHNPRNTLSSELDFCADFDGLNLWFEGTDEVRRLWTYR